MTKAEQQFIATVWQYYHKHGRHDLPWRHTTDPYRIVVSEVMLQQTQVSRVIIKYKAFLRAFPNTKRLAEAPLAAVLTCWQGLGYNRRAKLLQQAAQAVHQMHAGRWPRTYEELQALPGIGPYTAGAVMAFAYNEPVPIIETNIRTVYLQHFFPSQTEVTDAAIQALVARTLPPEQAREWYWALMDYGTYIKTTIGNSNHRSRHYQKQARFKGSMRETRGAIIRYLGTNGPTTQSRLCVALAGLPQDRIVVALAALMTEGLVVQKQGSQRYQLPD